MSEDLCSKGHDDWTPRRPSNGKRNCRTCDNAHQMEKRRAAGIEAHGSETKCRRGHSDWYVRPSGERSCRQCQSLYDGTRYWENRFKDKRVVLNGSKYYTVQDSKVEPSEETEADELARLIEEQEREMEHPNFVSHDGLSPDGWSDDEGSSIDSPWDYVSAHLSINDPHSSSFYDEDYMREHGELEEMSDEDLDFLGIERSRR